MKKIFVGVFLGALLLIGAAFGILAVRDARRLDVAYYGLPQAVVDALGTALRTIDMGEYYPNGMQESVLTAYEAQNETVLKKKYDMLFMWNGAEAVLLANGAKPISRAAYGALPSAIRKAGTNEKMLPVLLNHYELACLQESAWQNIAESFDAFQAYLALLQGTVAYPLFCAGSDDETLLAFVGALVESIAGESGYAALVSEIAKGRTFEECLADAQGVTLQSALDVILSWQKTGVLHASWTSATWEDALSFMNAKTAGVVFMSLLHHRSVPMRTIQNYEAISFPVHKSAQSHALVAPAVSLLFFSDNENFCSDIALALVSEMLQSYLSDLTQLSPTASRGGAFDRQADDVRYWAASRAGGPVADLGKIAFASTEAQALFANKLRNYLRTH